MTPPSTSRGAQLLSKIGYKPGSTLGRADNPNALKQPIVQDVKDDRSGIGHESEKKRKVREAFAEQEQSEKKRKGDEGDFRVRVAKEREEKRMSGQVRGAMSVLEGLEEKAIQSKNRSGIGDDDADTAHPLNGSMKRVNVLYRGLIRERAKKEWERRARYDLMQSLSKNASYSPEDEEIEAQDRIAIGKEEVPIEEDDPELDSFEALEVRERLDQLVVYLREKYYYCFWCKYSYRDESMDGCPGPSEDEHG